MRPMQRRSKTWSGRWTSRWRISRHRVEGLEPAGVDTCDRGDCGPGCGRALRWLLPLRSSLGHLSCKRASSCRDRPGGVAHEAAGRSLGPLRRRTGGGGRRHALPRIAVGESSRCRQTHPRAIYSLGRTSARAQAAVASKASGTRGEPLADALYLDGRLGLVDDMLLYFDRVSMAHSLELRVPFLDHRLVELAARIPSKHKVDGSDDEGCAPPPRTRPGPRGSPDQAQGRLLQPRRRGMDRRPAHRTRPRRPACPGTRRTASSSTSERCDWPSSPSAIPAGGR